VFDLSNDTQYAYAVARIRAVEKKLLDKGNIDRMVDAKTPEEALKVAIDAGYGSSSGEALDALEYEQLLKEEQKKTYRLLKEIAPEPEVFDLFLRRNDYHNIKVLLKSEFLGQQNDEILVDTGSIPLNKLKVMLKDRNLADMPVIMRKAIEECIDTFNRTGDPQTIDLILDRASFRQMKDAAEASNNGFLKNLIEILIDLANIKIFLRVKSLKKSWDFLQRILLAGGSIDSKLFVDNIDESYDSFMTMLNYKPYSKLAEGIESFKNTGSLTKFEKFSDNYVTSFIKKAIFRPLGIEPLVGYLIAKENEIRNVRIVMVGKMNNISNDIIRERLRETYV